MSYRIRYTGRFKKAYKRCMKRGCDESLLLGGLWVIYASDQKSRQEYKPKKKENRR